MISKGNRLPQIRLGELNASLIAEKYRTIFEISNEEVWEFARIVKGYSFAFHLLGALLWEAGKSKADEGILF